MSVKEKIQVVVKNIELINKQVKEGDKKAIAMGQLYNMTLTHPDHPTIALFESAFDDWYKENSE